MNWSSSWSQTGHCIERLPDFDLSCQAANGSRFYSTDLQLQQQQQQYSGEHQQQQYQQQQQQQYPQHDINLIYPQLQQQQQQQYSCEYQQQQYQQQQLLMMADPSKWV